MDVRIELSEPFHGAGGFARAFGSLFSPPIAAIRMYHAADSASADAIEAALSAGEKLYLRAGLDFQVRHPSRRDAGLLLPTGYVYGHDSRDGTFCKRCPECVQRLQHLEAVWQAASGAAIASLGSDATYDRAWDVAYHVDISALEAQALVSGRDPEEAQAWAYGWREGLRIVTSALMFPD